MTAADLLADLSRRGFTLTAGTAGVRVSPFSRLQPEQRLAIRAHKAELLRLLAASSGEAERLLAEVRQAVAEVGQKNRVGGVVPEPLANVLADAVAIAQGYVANGELELLRTLSATVRQYGVNWREIRARKAG
jgi:hypothetical protein